MSMRRVAARMALSVGIALTVMVGLGATDSSARFNDLGHRMMCTCGCAQVLLECNHVGCTVSGQMRNELSDALTGGQNDSLILQSFVQRYGATVLAAPTTQGFDLVAWIMPFAVSLLALIGTVYLVRHWARQTRPGAVMAGTSPAAQDELRARIRRETGTEE